MRFAQSKLVAPAVLALTLSLAGCGSSTSDHDPGAASSPVASSSTPTAMDSASPSSSPHNAGDVLFAQQMIQHHNQATAMSELLLAKNEIDPRVRALAQKIKDAQAPEVAKMKGMIEHHAGAIAMAQAELEQGANHDAKEFAQAIIDAQQAEIAQMKHLRGK